MRLFVAVRPPDPVLDRVEEAATRLHAGLGGSSGPAARLRWTTRAQWHVTLRFLGDVPDPGEVTGPLAAALDGHRSGPGDAALGPVVTSLGRAVACIPVTGLDVLAGTVGDATRHLGRPDRDRPFTGHLTVARARGRRGRVPRLPEVTVAATWPVDEVRLMRSHTHPDGARYETLAAIPLT